MRAYVSLWSADLLAIGKDVDLIADQADGLHIDVFDGHNVPELLFGPDFVAALRAHTPAFIDVHLNVEDPDSWAARFIDAGADMITVQVGASPDPRRTMHAIAAAGARPGVGLEVEDPPSAVVPLLEDVDRVLVMGTEIGIKGVDLHADTPVRLTALAHARDRSVRRPEIVVDGGIRRHTVPALAAAGADGVVPGSLVFADSDPRAAIAWVHGHGPRSAAPGPR